MPSFVPGLELSRNFYHELVRPILDVDFPGLLYSAALLGRGSEVLGFDDEMSTDHDWKLRVLLPRGGGPSSRPATGSPSTARGSGCSRPTRSITTTSACSPSVTASPTTRATSGSTC
jgi:hypothetical protein